MLDSGRKILLAVTIGILIFAPVSMTVSVDHGAPVAQLHIQTAEAVFWLPVMGAVGIATYFFGGDAVASAFWKVMKWLAYIIFFIAGTVLAAAGLAFDYSIYFFATNFGELIADKLKIVTAITSIWTTFRDLADIVIIGFFVFVAFSVILNNHTYGTKANAIRTIVIALLINFSLFFSMAVIDVSNFVAYQFYRGIARVGGTHEVGPGAMALSGYEKQGNISKRIATSFGIVGLIDSKETVESITKLNGNDDMKTFFSLIGMSALFSIAAYVFIYISLLLVLRGVRLIVVMATSSLAVACYIVPSGKLNAYFKKWLDALISGAIFAPLILVFLWAVIQIMDAMALGKIPAEGLIKPDTSFIDSLIRYFVMAFLLIASAKIADELSQNGGDLFGWDSSKLGSSMRFGGALMGGMTGAAFGGLAAASRATQLASGRRQLRAAEAAVSNAKDARSHQDALDRLDKIKGRLDRTGDFRDGSIAKALKAMGVNMGSGTKETLKKTIDAKQKKEEGRAKAAEPFVRKAMEDAEKKTKAEAEDRSAKEAYSTEADKLVKAIKESKDQKEAAKATLSKEESAVSTLEKQVAADKQRQRDKYADASITDPERKEMENRQSELTQKTAAIEELKQKIHEHEANEQTAQAQKLSLDQTSSPEAIDRRREATIAAEKKEEERLKTLRDKGADSALRAIKATGVSFGEDGTPYLHGRLMKSAEENKKADKEAEETAWRAKVEKAVEKKEEKASDSGHGSSEAKPKAPAHAPAAPAAAADHAAHPPAAHH